jgi:hypothetical protein
MKRGLVVLVLLAGLVAVPLAYALLAEQPVLNTRRNERNPAADVDGSSNEVLAFTRSRSGYPNRYDAWAQVEGTAAVKLNAAGQGWTGGIDYPIVAYQQIASGQSNVHLYDFSDQSRTATEANTSRWEWHPSVQGDEADYELLFGRDDTNTPTQRVMYLHHSDAPFVHDERLVSSVSKASHYLQPDQLNGDFATYTRCTPVCNVVRYQISTTAKIVLAKPVTSRPRQQYAGAVTSTGALYLVRSGPNCGEKVKIVRYDTARSDPALGTVVAALPSGFDVAFAFARENLDGSVDVFYDRVRCSTGRFDIYKVTDPAPGP